MNTEIFKNMVLTALAGLEREPEEMDIIFFIGQVSHIENRLTTEEKIQIFREIKSLVIEEV